MAEGSVITEEMRSAVGRLLNVAIAEVERGKLQRYVDAMGETNPLYQCEVLMRGRSTNSIGPCSPTIRDQFNLGKDCTWANSFRSGERKTGMRS